MTVDRFEIVCAVADVDVGGSLRDLVLTLTENEFDVEWVPNPDALMRRLEILHGSGVQVPIVLASDHSEGMGGVELLGDVKARPCCPGTRTLLVTHDATTAEAAVAAGHVDGYVMVPWKHDELRDTLDRLITAYLIDQAPAALEEMPEIVDVELLSHAFTESGERERSVRVALEEARRGLLAYTDLSDDETEMAMVEEVERVLDRPARRVYPAGSLLLEEGRQVDGVTIVLDGRVTLFLDVDGEEVPFHVRTAGRILGVLALARNEPAYFSARAETDVTAIDLTVTQLEEALQHSETLGGLFVSVLLRSMVRRIRRSVELRLDLDRARMELKDERDQLALALQQLDMAQSQLIEQEKMALLGQLVAGVGHELNNPVAAILRAADYIEHDVTALTTRHPEAARFTDVLLGALHAEPVSTRVEREQRRDLANALGDDALAGRLVRAGITTPDAARALFREVPETGREELLSSLEAYRRLGTAIRNLRTGGTRIASLVGSLRSYARRPEEVVDDVDVSEGLDETLLLLGHRMRDITVERRYDPIPLISARPGELNQVWTNLIVNAIQVMEGRGTLEVATDQPNEDEVRVRVIDGGPGIAPEDLHRIFDLAFTTKQGRVDFGLGLGLRIAQDIVARHGGRIEVESRPGRTCFAVTLPVRQTGGKEATA